MTSYEKLRDYDHEFVQDNPIFAVTCEERWQNDQIAIDAFRSKYAIDELEKVYPAYAYWRVATYIASAEIDDGESVNQALELAETFFNMMWNFEIVPGGRIMVGAGNPSQVSLINCTTVQIHEDSLEGIWGADYTIGKVESRGEGVGVDITPLRPKGMKVNNAAKTTSGAISWMAKFDATTGTVSQMGRRGALLISIKITHPEVIDFIKVKSDLRLITNANISIQITDAFMQAVIDDGEWELFWESADGRERVSEMHRARDIMRMLAEHSSKFAEPGLQFYDVAARYSNSDALGYPVISTNACSEQWLTHLDSCVLGHANWATLPLEPLAAGVESGRRGYYLAWFLDNVVTKQLVDKRSPLPGSAEKSVLLRRIGAGYTGLADYLALRGITYGSDESLELSRDLAACHVQGAYRRSMQAGKEKGSFFAFDPEKINNSAFIKNMQLEGILPERITHLRNVCTTTVAPVGTGMLMVLGWANGAEPGLGYAYWRRTRISGEYVWYFIVNPFTYKLIKDKETAEIIRDLADKINLLKPGKERFELENSVLHNIQNQIDGIHKFSHEIDPMDKAKLIGVLQKYCDSSISITFNMPQSTTVEQIEELYIEGWRQGLKGLSIYREDPDNRPPIFQFTRPTTFNYTPVSGASKPTVRVGGYRDRPDALSGYTETVKAEGEKFYFTYNLDGENSLYEVFATTNVREPKANTEKALASLTAMLGRSGVDSKYIDDQIAKSNHQHSTVRVCRLVSLALRNSIPIDTIVNALEEVEVTVSSYIFHLRRGLNKFKGTVIETCPSCGDNAMVVGGGCEQCASCGYSKC